MENATKRDNQSIAGGVESREQRTFLDTIGADAVQGFLYLRPTTAEKFGAWLGSHLAGLSRPLLPRVIFDPMTPRRTA